MSNVWLSFLRDTPKYLALSPIWPNDSIPSVILLQKNYNSFLLNTHHHFHPFFFYYEHLSCSNVFNKVDYAIFTVSLLNSINIPPSISGLFQSYPKMCLWIIKNITFLYHKYADNFQIYIFVNTWWFIAFIVIINHVLT